MPAADGDFAVVQFAFHGCREFGRCYEPSVPLPPGGMEEASSPVPREMTVEPAPAAPGRWKRRSCQVKRHCRASRKSYRFSTVSVPLKVGGKQTTEQAEAR